MVFFPLFSRFNPLTTGHDYILIFFSFLSLLM